MYRRVLAFDFDGTLADSFPWFLVAVNEGAARFGYGRIEEAEREDLRRVYPDLDGSHGEAFARWARVKRCRWTDSSKRPCRGRGCRASDCATGVCPRTTRRGAAITGSSRSRLCGRSAISTRSSA